ncbi:MAG: lysophospholipid acyltransferase family protein [Verrucomicrobia bacterium]|nr:lysophospholipid acyltransferase family protein [Verrucomicrobiota bacterium]
MNHPRSIVDPLLNGLAHTVIGLIRALPLRTVARLGRWVGRVVGCLDLRHRRMARRNLEQALGGELTPRAIRRTVWENFGRIGENFACAVRTADMSAAEVRDILEVVGSEKILPHPEVQPPPSRVVAIGHFGNFELFASAFGFAPGYRFATTYRALRQPALNRLMQDLREKSGCEFFERRLQGDMLRAAMSRGGLLLGLLADQHAGRSGVWGPFFGRRCSTTPAPAVMALRYRCPLFTAICYRAGLARWRIEVGDEIPTRVEGKRRSVADITADINRAFEAAIRRDPANWFWVHNRWKQRRLKAGGTPRPSVESTLTST